MLIDWFTFIAQVVNFLILMLLLKRFLYRPILSAIDAREQRIVAQIADADAQRRVRRCFHAHRYTAFREKKQRKSVVMSM